MTGEVSEGKTICGACRSDWPCDCEQAAPVVLQDTANDLAYRMGEGRKDPMAIRAIDPDPVIRADEHLIEGNCRHRGDRFDVDPNMRVVICRHCSTRLDPFAVLVRLSLMLSGEGMRLHAAQELEEREAKRHDERKAKARVRRHRYAPFSYRGGVVSCAACGGEEADEIHTENARPDDPREVLP